MYPEICYYFVVAGDWQLLPVPHCLSRRKWCTYGFTTLPNKEGIETALYLARDSNHNGLIPVPKIYFRVIIQPTTQKGIVFVGVNNPHLTLEQIQKDYIFCTDVSDKVTYINWKKADITASYSYACEVADFLKTVKHLPALTTTGGLLL